MKLRDLITKYEAAKQACEEAEKLKRETQQMIEAVIKASGHSFNAGQSVAVGNKTVKKTEFSGLDISDQPSVSPDATVQPDLSIRAMSPAQ